MKNRDNGGGDRYYNLGGFTKYGILVPRTVPAEVVVRMMAALLSFELGVQSIDYQLKQYRTELEESIMQQYVEGPAK